MNTTNIRLAVHIIAVVAMAIAGGSVVFAGIPEAVAHDIIVIATIIGLICTTYLTSTSTGQNAASKPTV